MRYATNYVLSKGVVPILWHDMVLQFPECLSAFDERVLFEFWHYGDASHGSMEIPLQTLLKYIPAKRIIGSPGARAEKQHGALHHHPALLEANISEMNLRMAEIGALGTILTDWPDTGCSFFDAFYSIRAQGKAAWTGRELPLSFRHDYARNVFGMDTPELPDKLDSIAGTCAFARGFQYRTCHEVNRFSRASYDFEKEVTAVCKDYEGDGEEELYRLIGRRYAARIFMDWLKDHQRRCQKNHLEFEWYILLAEMTLLFLAVDIGIRKDCFVRRYFPSVSKELVERFQVCEYLNKALMSFDTVKQHYQKFHLPYSMERNLANCCEELFPVALKKGLEDFVDKKTVNQIWSQQ